MTASELLALIQTNQTLVDMMSSRDDIGIADILNTPSITVSKECFVTKRTLFDWFGIIRGTEIMIALRNLAKSENENALVIAEIVDLLEKVEAGGLNIGHPDNSQIIPLLILNNIIDTGEANKLISYSQQLISPAMNEFKITVTPVNVKAARRLAGIQ